MNISINDIQTGDTWLVKSDSFLSRVICRVMKHWGKKCGLNTNLVYSHAARFVWIADELYLFGSVENGYNPIPFLLHYDLKKSNYAIMRRRLPLAEDGKKKTTRYCLHLDTISLSYQYWNLFQWLAKVYLNINLFRKDSDKFLYCYEAERKARKDLNPDHYKEVFITDVFDLLDDPYYVIIAINDPTKFTA
jgi:hypothetical protein